jgi:Protein of unknown function (DUF3305)
MSIAPLARIPVGVVIERRKATSPWIDFVWRPLAVLPGLPATAPWTILATSAEVATFYVGAAEIALYRSEAARYRDNLASGTPSVWVALRPTRAEPPYRLLAVTADPSEGEAFTQAGDDLIGAVPMPAHVRASLEAFVAAHPIEDRFHKRERDRADPEALARRNRTHKDLNE